MLADASSMSAVVSGSKDQAENDDEDDGRRSSGGGSSARRGQGAALRDAALGAAAGSAATVAAGGPNLDRLRAQVAQLQQENEELKAQLVSEGVKANGWFCVVLFLCHVLSSARQ